MENSLPRRSRRNVRKSCTVDGCRNGDTETRPNSKRRNTENFHGFHEEPPQKEVNTQEAIDIEEQNPGISTEHNNIDQQENLRATISDMVKEAMKEATTALKDAVNDAVQEKTANSKTIQRQQPRVNNQNTRRQTQVTSDSSSEEELESIDSESNQYRWFKTTNRSSGCKLPAFTGSESWDVWYNRFSDVAIMNHWSKRDKLNELLPRLQGIAGEFVYGQLSRKARTNIDKLVDELRFRFRRIETPRAYGAAFSNRNQKPEEQVESYASELKRLYDKAHASRDHVTRTEDLLRRFLDGLQDDAARFHVEYIKEPRDIDEAVYQVVHFLETNRNSRSDSRRPARAAKFQDDRPGSDRDIHNTTKAKQDHSQTFNKQEKKTPSFKTGSSSAAPEIKEINDRFENMVKIISERIDKLEQIPLNNNNPRINRNNDPGPGLKPRETFTGCFKCGGNHYARECSRNQRYLSPHAPVFQPRYPNGQTYSRYGGENTQEVKTSSNTFVPPNSQGSTH